MKKSNCGNYHFVIFKMVDAPGQQAFCNFFIVIYLKILLEYVVDFIVAVSARKTACFMSDSNCYESLIKR